MIEESIKALCKQCDVLLAAHLYQRDEIVALADVSGDSLELAKKALLAGQNNIVFCGVGFMGQSVKILAPHKRVFMPKLACCSMARMIDSLYFDESLSLLESYGIAKEQILPLTYINSSAEVKAKVGAMGGMVCTSANATIIMSRALQEGKTIFFLPDRCLGQNLAKSMNIPSSVLGISSPQEVKRSKIICYNGFCSVHQLFSAQDVHFYREKYPNILIAVHPECDPSVVALADFVGSTSQIIAYVASLPMEQKVAVGTEFNLVNRLRKENTYVLSSSKPECPTMNETRLEDVLACLEALDRGESYNEIVLDEALRQDAFLALDRMMRLS